MYDEYYEYKLLARWREKLASRLRDANTANKPTSFTFLHLLLRPLLLKQGHFTLNFLKLNGTHEKNRYIPQSVSIFFSGPGIISIISRDHVTFMAMPVLTRHTVTLSQ